MIYVYATILSLVNLMWLVLTALGLPGNWLMIGSAFALMWLYDSNVFSTTTLIVVVVLALIGEVIEFLAGALGSKKAGGSVWGSVGATIGGIGGAIAGTLFLGVVMIPPPISTLVGAVGGAFAGSAVMEISTGKKRDQAVKVGTGAAIGHITGVISKLIVGGLIWLIITIAAFWP